jgi:hypothetical protein
VRDITQVEAMEPERALVLLARGRPLGEARVVIELSDLHPGSAGGDDSDRPEWLGDSERNARCLITMTEDAVSSGARIALPPALRRSLISARNRESLARLVALAERRTKP